MDFMKVLDQTVREIKREVNLKVLKVPEIEQKVLDAPPTSDEPWGPHGSALAELAQATKKFSECQMIMNVLWTRLTDTANTTSNQVDLFGESLVDLMDAPTSTPSEPAFFSNTNTPEVDLFADATFVSASPHSEATPGSHDQDNVDLFASQPAFPPPPAANVANVDLFGASEVKYSTSEPEHSTTFDPFAVPDSSKHADTKSSASEATNTKAFDPFAAIPLNNFEESDSFGAFTSHTQSVTTEPQQNATKNSLRSLEQTSSMASKPAPMKNAFQVKSGVWADSLSRGLIDLNITAPKKANLAGIGIVGGLGDTSNNGKGTATPWYMADTTVGLGSGIPPSNPSMGGTSFSTSGQQQYGSFK
ncbi:LOW QUALITY PROTEIN: clathrin interactor EPSIN 1-like [Asparagus officinalis]|uniref:LOW QUALITY PROTEIN: clathrin interactor EPSIN 1-like n=1 Tax=Asparagus officinalis TaxID=4686 RepID=UPI00098E64E7|nr:LOW QUALITY PROTEIN: clathrin interactor EPSIN 1-like [Asparagus officinalis]